MNEKMRESLSALMDDEANELEIERVLARIGEDEALRARWVRYQAARSALSGQAAALAHLDVSRAVSAAVSRPQGGRAAVASGLGKFLLRPLGSFAVAASVAATVVIGGQQAAQLGGIEGMDAAVTQSVRPSPVSALSHFMGVPVRASFGTRPAVVELEPATHAAYQELARQRKHRYIQAHVEQAALNSPQGLVPFARVPQIRD